MDGAILQYISSWRLFPPLEGKNQNPGLRLSQGGPGYGRGFPVLSYYTAVGKYHLRIAIAAVDGERGFHNRGAAHSVTLLLLSQAWTMISKAVS